MAKKINASPDIATNAPLLIEFHPENAVLKELGSVPERHRDRFITSLGLLSKQEPPTCKVKPLDSLGHSVYELIINGSPAWRCIYTTELTGKIVVLHVTDKTTNGRDRQIANVVEERLKTLRQKVSKEGKKPKKPKPKKK